MLVLNDCTSNVADTTQTSIQRRHTQAPPYCERQAQVQRQGKRILGYLTHAQPLSTVARRLVPEGKIQGWSGDGGETWPQQAFAGLKTGLD